MGSKKRSSDPFLYGRQRNELLDSLNEALKKESIDRQSYDEVYNMLTAEAKESGLDDSGTILSRGGIVDYFSVAQSVQKKLSEASEYFAKAVEGTDPKFKARRKTELLYKTIADQPGRRQFISGPTTGRRGSAGLLGL